MITNAKAIDTAVRYLEGLPGELLGGPKDVRLESIERMNGEWIVILSYASDAETETTHSPLADSPLGRALRAMRRYKEFDIDAESGEVIRMSHPKADA